MTKLRRLCKRCLLLAGSLLFAFLIAEFALRILSISYPLPYVPDPYCGMRLRPDFSGWFVKEGRAFVQTNSDGHRDREHSLSKPDDVLRIAVLGDSFTEALQVPLEETFWHLLQQRLGEKNVFPDRKIEVMNFGVSGFGTAQELQMLRQYVWKYEPDIVILAFFSGNDLTDNSKALKGGEIKPYFTLENDELVYDDSFKELDGYRKGYSAPTKWKVWAINQSRVLQLLNQAKSVWQQRRKTSKGFAQLHEMGLDPGAYRPPVDENWESAWSVTERLILKMQQEVTAKKADFWLVSVCSAIQVDPDLQKRVDFLRSNELDDLYYADKRIEQFCIDHDIPHVILAPKLSRYVVGKALSYAESVYLHGFSNTRPGTGHWNAIGHRVSADMIADALQAHYLSDPMTETSESAAGE